MDREAFPIKRVLPAVKNGGFADDRYWIWCGSVIRGEDGKYQMFASAWPKELGFGAQWLFNSAIVRAESDRPEGPYILREHLFPERDRTLFDGMNMHNPCICRWNGRYYLYYTGTTYGGPVPQRAEEITQERFIEVWNKKRIGLAVADSVYGPWKRLPEPAVGPRDCSHWDCTIATNPTAAVLEDGTTYMIYKSRAAVGEPMQLGVVRAPRPDGPFERISEEPILRFDDKKFEVEDPFLWHRDGWFYLIFKNDCKENWQDLSRHWGAGLCARSRDCIRWEIFDEPLYTRRVRWDDGSETVPVNLERPWILFDDDGRPAALFLAHGDGSRPYNFDRLTRNVVMPLEASE